MSQKELDLFKFSADHLAEPGNSLQSIVGKMVPKHTTSSFELVGIRSQENHIQQKVGSRSGLYHGGDLVAGDRRFHEFPVGK